MEGSIAKIFFGLLQAAAKAFVNKPTFAPISIITGALVTVFFRIAFTSLGRLIVLSLLIIDFLSCVDFAQSASHLIFWLNEKVLLSRMDLICTIMDPSNVVFFKTLKQYLVCYDFKCQLVKASATPRVFVFHFQKFCC